METLYSWNAERSGAAITVRHSCGKLAGVSNISPNADGSKVIATFGEGKMIELATGKIKHKLLMIEAPAPADPDVLTVTLHGPQTEDRGRVMRVLMHLFDGPGEWDHGQPNVRLVVSTDA